MTARTPRLADDPQYLASLHRLPEPAPTCPDAPFVGNQSLEENLEEAVRVALWNAAGGSCDAIEASIFGGTVVLSGTTQTAEIASRCEDQVRAVRGVTSVNNLLSWPGPDRDL